MHRYDQLYRLYAEFDADRLRAYQGFVDLFPPVDSPVALAHWQDAREELDARKAEIRRAMPDGELYAEVAARATREMAFTALDLASAYGRGVTVLVLDVDETLRSAGTTDNEIPRETLHLLTEFHESGVPIVVCTGQTLENVKGFLIQGLGSELFHSGRLSVVYEAGTGVFTPGHGADTKRLLYEDLGGAVRRVFDAVRSRVLSAAPDDLRRGCHLQGNEFNVTLKPNHETGSDEAREIIDRALDYQLRLLGSAVASEVAPEADAGRAADWARTFYARADPEIRAVLDDLGTLPAADDGDEGRGDADAIPPAVRDLFERVDVAYYEADAAEIGSLELNKVVGVRAALDVLGVDDPFALVVGDSKSDLRVMRWAREAGVGIAAAPEHASAEVLEFVRSTDDLVYAAGDAAELLGTAYALNLLAELD